MIRPLTCLSLIAALGAGLYLYQEKHRAQLLDRDITRTVKQADQARERIGLLKAEWALLNEPERLAGLATQHLSLQPLQPAQFARLEDLRSRLPAISVAPPPAPAAMDLVPIAAATPTQPPRALAAAVPALPTAGPAALTPTPVRVATATPAAKPVAAPLQFAAIQPTPKPATPRVQVAAARPEAEPAAHASEPVRRALFAPVMPAYAPTPVLIHAPTVQTASATAPVPAFVGSALGMGRTALAAPVPVGSASALGYSAGR